MTLSKQEKTRLQSKYGNWAIVTGASSGIGRALAKDIASAGINLIISARNEQALESLKAELAHTSVDIKIVPANLAQSEGANLLLSETSHLDIGLLVASAGYGTSGSILQTSVHAELDMLQVNCKALLELTHHFSRYFAQKKKGGIILMSSMVAFQGVPFSANYAATKAYVQSLAEGLAIELKPHGVDVLAAAPGPVSSGFGQRANMNMNLSMTPDQVSIPILKALGRKNTVLPGRLTKFLVYSLNTVPRWGKVRIMKIIMQGMTKHQLA